MDRKFRHNYQIVDNWGNTWDAGMTLEDAKDIMRYLILFARFKDGEAKIVKVGG